MFAEFDTSRMEMGAVADLFDRNGEGLIDWQEFIAALRPDWQQNKPPNDADKIHDEVKRLVMLCTCRQKFRVFQVGEGKYRVSYRIARPLLDLFLTTLVYIHTVWRLTKVATRPNSAQHCDGARWWRMGCTGRVPGEE